MATTAASSPTDAISYDDLYARWERGNWRATEIDFTQDKVDWQREAHRPAARGALWLYTLFFHGEDSVADNLSPYIDAAPLEEQKYFLTTQQVDEARHAVFFKRFMHEVVGLGDGSDRRRAAGDGPRHHLGPPHGLRAPRPHGRRAARRPLARRSSPRRSRCTTSSSRRASPSPAST